MITTYNLQLTQGGINGSGSNSKSTRFFNADKKAQEDHKQMLSGLKKNDEVVTSGGIHGTITNVKDHSVVVKIDDNVKVEVDKASVTRLKKSK